MSADVSIQRARFGDTLAYVVQGFAFTAIVTSLPALKDRYELGDMAVGLVNLGVVVGAALGSVLADRLAVRFGSRIAVTTALTLQGLALVAVALGVPFPVFVVAIVAFGLGLGASDAGQAMQAVLIQRRIGKSVVGSFFAAFTAAGIVATVVTSFSTATTLGMTLTVSVAAVVALAAASAMPWLLDPSRERGADAVREHHARKLPVRGIVLVGLLLLGAFVADSTVQSWSSIYLSDTLGAPEALVPLGLGVYLALTLITRTALDFVVRAYGRFALGAVTMGIAIGGAVLLALVPHEWVAIAGFGVMGLGVGAIVPLVYSAAGDLAPERSDEVVARVNIFQYGGSVVGAVVPGFISDAIGLNWAFLVPALLLAPLVLAVGVFRAPKQESTAQVA